MSATAILLAGGFAALFLGLTLLIAAVLGVSLRARDPQEVLRRRLSLYSLTGRGPKVAEQQEQRGSLSASSLARGALVVADRVVRQREFDQVLQTRLEAAGLPIRTAEWMLIHVGSAVGAGLLLMLLGGGSLLPTAIGLLLGLIGPWLFLAVRQDRREAAFLALLPDSLQMLAGSLQAGHSLPQALDAVVREGDPPLSNEFSRALIETRLGIPVEDALEGIAERMSSDDFSWVVMAIRIQREVGGNLAELLTTVAETLRERERLRRQMQVLSAEGRLSAWILGALPVVFTLYLAVARPEYLAPLGTPFGVFLVGLAVLLLVIGAVWLSRVVKVRV